MAKPIQGGNAVHLDVRPLQILLLISPFFAGLFYEWLSCLTSLFLLGWLWYAGKKRERLQLPKSWTFLAAAIVALSYGLSALWAVDHGMALLGFVKFLPLPLFVLAQAQVTTEQRQSLLRTIPLSGAIMSVLSGVLCLIAPLREFVLVNARLAGFFQYPNVFALYLLLGIIVIVTNDSWGVWQVAVLAILLVGIFASGSRTTFVLLVAAVIWMSVRTREKRTRYILLGSMTVLLTATAVYALHTGDVSSVGRYITTSLHTSTFLGRLLYVKDALPVIVTHPLGLGYMGYFTWQGSFQTGVYSVVNIHNELLQLLLDVGWLPTLIVLYALVKGLRHNTPTGRAILLAITAHSMLDFDLQFIAIGFVALLAMDQEDQTHQTYGCGRRTAAAIGAILACVSIYFGMASVFYSFGAYQKAVTVYPAYTNAWLKILPMAQDAEAMDDIADKILAHNASVSLAYSAKARAAYAAGDFGTMITYKEKAISLAKYSQEEYLDYFAMLQTGIQLYTQNHDAQSAGYCRKKLLMIPNMMSVVEQQTSSIAWELDDRPQLTLPPDYQRFLAQLK